MAHAHVRLDTPPEAAAFLFRGWKERRYEEPLFQAFREAHYSDAAIYALPFTIAEGLAARRGVRREVFLERIAPRLSAGGAPPPPGGHRTRARRARGARSRHGAAHPAGELRAVPARRRARGAQGRARPGPRSRRPPAPRPAPGARYGRVAAVLDASYSSSGSSEKRRRPLAVALASSAFLRAASREYRAFWSPGRAPEDEILVEARGATDLARPLLQALGWGADVIAIVSDGYENDPPSGAAEVLRVYEARLRRPGGPFIVHLNPVFDAEGYAPRPLSSAAPTVGLREAEDLPTMIGFARFAAGASSLSELEAYLADRAARFVESARA